MQTQESNRRIREEALNRYKDHLASQFVVLEKKDAVIKQRYSKALQDLMYERRTWINSANMDAKITPNLFAEPSTTGIVTKHSKHWRYHVVPHNLPRIMAMEDDLPNPHHSDSDETHMDSTPSSIEERLQAFADSRLTKRLVVEDFLGQLISSGREREHFGELVGQMTKAMGPLDGFRDVNDIYEKVVDGFSGDFEAAEVDEEEASWDYEGEKDGEEEEMEELPALDVTEDGDFDFSDNSDLREDGSEKV